MFELETNLWEFLVENNIATNEEIKLVTQIAGYEVLFNDGTNPYMWAVNTLLGWFPECNKEELEKELDLYI